MDAAMKCPACNSEHAYQDRGLWVRPECAHEWSAEAAVAAEASPEPGVRDINGNLLAVGDSVIVIKDLKVKGSSSVVKGGTKCQEHPPDRGDRWPQHCLQDRRHRRDEL